MSLDHCPPKISRIREEEATPKWRHLCHPPAATFAESASGCSGRRRNRASPSHATVSAPVRTRMARVKFPEEAELILTPRSGGHQMESLQDRLIILLRAYRTIRFCDACLAMKLGAFPRDVREAVALIGEGFQISSGKCSECLLEKTVVCALAA